MCEAVERYVILSRPRADGQDLFSHLEQVANGTGIWPEEYEPIPPPEGSEFIWDTFWEIRNASPAGFSGPQRLSFQDFDAWQRVRGVALNNNIIDALLQMDSAYMREWHRKAPSRKAPAKTQARAPRKPIGVRRGR